jgi:low temperature requirement protein LtrA
MPKPPGQRVTFLELFFDLVFVYAVTQIVGFIRDRHSIGSYAAAALIFLIVWWAWSQFTWLGNAIDMDDRWHRVAVLAASGTAFFMARALPDAFRDGAPWFTVSYGLTMAIGLSLYWWGLRDDRDHQRALNSYLPIVIPATLIVAVAGFVAPGARTLVYLVAVVGLAASGAAAERGGAFRITASHFAERHSLIVIVALGESLIAVGVAASGLESTARSAAAIVVGVVGVLALWWAYYDWFAGKTEQHMHDTPLERRASYARDAYTFGHYPLVFGIVAFAVAIEEAVAHPKQPLETFALFGLGAGIALYLVTTAVVHLRSGGGVLGERIAAAMAMALLAAVSTDLDAIFALAGVVALLIAALTAEWLRYRSRADGPAVVGNP